MSRPFTFQKHIIIGVGKIVIVSSLKFTLLTHATVLMKLLRTETIRSKSSARDTIRWLKVSYTVAVVTILPIPVAGINHWLVSKTIIPIAPAVLCPLIPPKALFFFIHRPNGHTFLLEAHF